MAVNGNDKVYWSKKLPKYHLTEFSSSLITFFIFRMKMVHLVIFFFPNLLAHFSNVLLVQFDFYCFSYLFYST